MELKKFYILTKSEHQVEIEEEPILFNMDHIVSVKPIKMVINEQLMNGYWIRTSNGKKYRATKIPEDLRLMLDCAEKKRPITSGKRLDETRGLQLQ